MNTEPLFDRDEINEIILTAKLNRVEFFRGQSDSIKRQTRWWGFANCLTLLRQGWIRKARLTSRNGATPWVVNTSNRSP
jgi:hypothetical protein